MKKLEKARSQITHLSDSNNFHITLTDVIDNDIALLKLEKRITFSEFVYPVCLTEKVRVAKII